MAVVYKHIRKDTNEVFYIGIGSIKRAHTTKGRNKHWTRVVNKAGYEVIIISEGLSWEEACIEEIKLIKEYGRKDLNEGPLTNMTDGGDGSLNQVQTEEKKAKCKAAAVKQHKDGLFAPLIYTEEQMKHLREQAKQWHIDEGFTDEQRLKMSEAAKKQHQRYKEEGREYIGPNKGKSHSASSKEKMSAARKEYWRKKKLSQ